MKRVIEEVATPATDVGTSPRQSALAIASAAAVAVTLLIVGLADLSNTETVLLGVVQTFFSLLAGWIITHAYAKRSEQKAVTDIEELHQKNLRTYALKAAEKVENLSRELNRLAIYLNQELEERGYQSAIEELSAKEERIQSAIHILNTLKSVNDTSLSDWRGVIGDEIEEIRLRAEQREETLEKLVDRIQHLEEQSNESGSDGSNTDHLHREIDKLRRDMRFLAGNVAGNLWTATKPTSGSRQTYQSACSECGSPLSVRQRGKEGTKKGVTCKICDAKLVSEIINGAPQLRRRSTLEERVPCPACDTQVGVRLDELAGTGIAFNCTTCAAHARVTRTNTGLLVTPLGRQTAITEDFIEAVRRELPAQPWPKGIHESTAVRLQVSPTMVKKAIAQLILRGVFMDQFQGQLCTPAEKLALMRSLGREIS